MPSEHEAEGEACAPHGRGCADAAVAAGEGFDADEGAVGEERVEAGAEREAGAAGGAVGFVEVAVVAEAGVFAVDLDVGVGEVEAEAEREAGVGAEGALGEDVFDAEQVGVDEGEGRVSGGVEVEVRSPAKAGGADAVVVADDRGREREIGERAAVGEPAADAVAEGEGRLAGSFFGVVEGVGGGGGCGRRGGRGWCGGWR